MSSRLAGNQCTTYAIIYKRLRYADLSRKLNKLNNKTLDTLLQFIDKLNITFQLVLSYLHQKDLQNEQFMRLKATVLHYYTVQILIFL